MKAKYVLVTDSACDLPLSYLQSHDVPFISLNYTIDDVTYPDDCGASMSFIEFYARMRAGSSLMTTMVNTQSYITFFEKFLKEKMDVVYICFSSGLSGSYNSAVLAVQELSSAYPNKVYVADSLSASMGFGLLVHNAVGLRDSGMPAEQLAEWVENNRQSFNHFFTIDNLMYIFRGGRLSRTSAVMGTLVGIKPILTVNHLGKLVAIDKCRGRAAALMKLVDKMEDRAGDYDDIFISHGDALKEARVVESEIFKRFGQKSVMINDIGPTVGTHSGAGTVSLFFRGRPRNE